jgi:hypothetical protein
MEDKMGMGEIRNAYTILIRKPEDKGPHERPRCKQEDNIRVHHREVRWEGVD